MSDIIVTGYGRSGTSLLYVMLAGTVGGYQFFETEIDALNVVDDNPKITKRPLDLFNIDEIEKRIPDVKWIVVLRDPRSVLCSTAGGTEDYIMSWDTARTSLGYPAPGLIARDRAIDRLKNPIFVRFEHLVTTPNWEQERLRQALGLEMEGHFADHERWPLSDVWLSLMNGKRRLDKSRLSSWRRHWERVVQQFEEAPELFDILIKRGYEPDRSWYDESEAGVRRRMEKTVESAKEMMS